MTAVGSRCRRGGRHGAVRRRRAVALLRLLVFLGLVFLAAWAGTRVAQAGDDARAYTGERYVVRAGDTLWGVATAHYGDSCDPRRAVWELRVVNRLAGPTLRPGQVLVLPRLGGGP